MVGTPLRLNRMSKIPSITERELRDLKPHRLDDSFLNRLTACAGETFTHLSAEESGFEGHLVEIRPAALHESFVGRLQEKIGDAPFAVSEKIVLFNRSNRRGNASRGNRSKTNILRFNIAAAAAVAILGALAAFMVPATSPTVAEEEPLESLQPLAPASLNFAPAAYERTLSGTSDEGIIWQNGTRPYRVLRHTITDKITGDNGKGGKIEVEAPSIEYSLIPEKID